MNKIKLGEEVVVYTEVFTPSIPKEILLFGINEFIQNNKTETSDAFNYHNEYPELDEIEKAGIDLCLRIAEQENIKYNTYFHNSWINRVRKETPIQYFLTDEPYHNHVLINQINESFVPMYTCIYYLQMPNNIKEDEGHLVLRDKKGDKTSILPKEGEFLVHSSDLDHYPKNAPNSTVDRLIFATNVGFTK